MEHLPYEKPFKNSWYIGFLPCTFMKSNFFRMHQSCMFLGLFQFSRGVLRVRVGGEPAVGAGGAVPAGRAGRLAAAPPGRNTQRQ